MKIEIEIQETVISAIAEEVVSRLRPLLAAWESQAITAPHPSPEGKGISPGRVFLNEREVSLRTGLALGTLRNYRHRCEGPPYYKINGRSVRYKEAEVAAWVEAHKISLQRRRRWR